MNSEEQKIQHDNLIKTTELLDQLSSFVFSDIKPENASANLLAKLYECLVFLDHPKKNREFVITAEEWTIISSSKTFNNAINIAVVMDTRKILNPFRGEHHDWIDPIKLDYHDDYELVSKYTNSEHKNNPYDRLIKLIIETAEDETGIRISAYSSIVLKWKRNT